MSNRRFSYFVGGVTAATLAALASVPAVAQDKITIGFSMPDITISFWTSMAYGVEDEAGKQGVDLVKVSAGGDANVNEQISQIQDLVQRKVSAMVVGATNGNAVAPVVEQAAGSGIPVVGLSSIPATDAIAAAVGADHYGMGKLQAQCLGEALGGEGKIGMMAGPAGQSWADNRANGFRETLAGEFPGIEMIAESRLADNRNKALTTMEDWLQRFPDINGVYSATDDIGAGVVAALQAAGKGDAVKVSTSNLSPAAQKLLEDGSFVCSSIQQIVLQGRVAVQQAIKAAKGEPTEGSVQTPALLVTRENLSTVDLSEVTAPADYKP